MRSFRYSVRQCLLSAVTLAACSTTELHPPEIQVEGASMSPGIVVLREDPFKEVWPPEYLPLYHVMVDGKFAVVGEHSYVEISPQGGSHGFNLPAGRHVFGLADQEGHVVATS